MDKLNNASKISLVKDRVIEEVESLSTKELIDIVQTNWIKLRKNLVMVRKLYGTRSINVVLSNGQLFLTAVKINSGKVIDPIPYTGGVSFHASAFVDKHNEYNSQTEPTIELLGSFLKEIYHTDCGDDVLLTTNNLFISGVIFNTMDLWVNDNNLWARDICISKDQNMVKAFCRMLIESFKLLGLTLNYYLDNPKYDTNDFIKGRRYSERIDDSIEMINLGFGVCNE